MWELFKVKMPNLRGVVRLPQKLKHLKEVPLEQFFEGLSNRGHIRPAVNKSRKENPQKPTQLSSRSHPRHLVGKRTAQKTPS